MAAEPNGWRLELGPGPTGLWSVTSPNPLVAPRQDSTTGYSGLGIAESAVDLYNGIASGSWVEGGLGLVGTGLEALSLVVDPIGTLLQYGISWLMEHVKPLSDALDWLAGDPDTISSYAQTWRNVSQAVTQARTDLDTAVREQTAAWTGEAGDAYRASAAQQSENLAAAATSAGTVGTVVEVVGILVGVVREIVRDLIAECVATLVARIPQWLAEEGVTLGLATPHVVASAVALIGKWVRRVADVIQKLVRSIEKLRPLLKKLDEIWEAIRTGLRKLGGGPSGPHHAPDTPDTPQTAVRPPDTDVTPPSASPDTAPTTGGPSTGPVSDTPTVPDGTPGTPGGPTPAATTPAAGIPTVPDGPGPTSTTPTGTTPAGTTAVPDSPTAPHTAGGPTPASTTPATSTDAPPTAHSDTGGSGSGSGNGAPPTVGGPDSPGIPPNPKRPHTLETLPETRVTRDGNGLITHVDGRPVKDYLADVAQQRAERIRQLVDDGDIPRNDVGPVSSVGIDTKTGEVFEAVNGRRGDLIPDDQLHPVLRERLEEMRANGPYQQFDRTTGQPLMHNGQPVMTEFPHGDNPLRHAEVKIVNEMLWRRGADVDSGVLNDFRVDNKFPFDPSGPIPAPCCANCNIMIGGVPSNAGRLTHAPGHPDLQELPE